MRSGGRTKAPVRLDGGLRSQCYLMTLKNAIRQPGAALLTSDGWAANAELIGRAAQHARRIETVPVVERHDLRARESRVRPWEMAREVWRAGGSIHLAPVRAPEAASS